MNGSIKALESLITNYSSERSEELLTELRTVFTGPDKFMDKVKKFDAVMSDHHAFDLVKEFAFDLLMSHHLDENNEHEEYFDSQEWLDIEERTMDRGTELLNILLYINESLNSDVEVSIEDFLYEFLLVDEDEFQDEHRIYEDLITNQDLVDESIDSILSVRTRIDHTSEIHELFVPLILFFREPNEKVISRETYNKLQPMDRALLAAMLSYRNG